MAGSVGTTVLLRHFKIFKALLAKVRAAGRPGGVHAEEGVHGVAVSRGQYAATTDPVYVVFKLRPIAARWPYNTLVCICTENNCVTESGLACCWACPVEVVHMVEWEFAQLRRVLRISFLV